MDILKNKKIIVIIAIIVVAFIAYNNFLKPDDNIGQFLISSAGDERLADGREILVLLEGLQSIDLNPEFFATNVFASLEDFSIPLDPEPKGRVNPFSPIE